MSNPIVETDLAEILNKIDSKIDKLDEKTNRLEVGQAEIKGEIKAVDTKVDQLEKRVGNVEFASRGILIGLSVVVLGGLAMFFWMTTKL